jgi:DNA invertase Pin-like site-specific DNA recombinase
MPRTGFERQSKGLSKRAAFYVMMDAHTGGATMPREIPSVSYLRMSSDQQDDSIEQQRPIVQALADANGYEILREYVDEGIIGLTANRANFLRMLADLDRLRDAKVILLWDSARLSRQDVIDASTWKQTLKNLGVTIHSHKQGKISWDTFENRILDAIHQEMAHAYSVGLSKDSVRGRLAAFEAGEWPNGKVPFGYDRLYVAPDGQRYLVRRLARFKMARGWKRIVIRNDDEAEVVRWIFAQFVERDTSLGALARELHERGIVRPDGDATRTWSRIGIKEILKNKAYAGWSHTGGAHNPLRHKTALNRVGPQEREGGIPAIITMDLWERAQERLGKLGTTGRLLKPVGASPLSGCVICGHCGHCMCKHERTDKSGVTYAYFTCDGKKRPGNTCKQWRVRESILLPTAIETLIREMDRQYLASLQAEPEEPDGRGPIDSLKRQLEEIDDAIKKGTQRLLRVDDSLVQDVERTLLEYKKRRDEAELRLRTLTMAEGDVTDFARWWEGIKGKLIEVLPGHTIYAADPESQWENPEAEGLLIEKEKIRGLLKGLGLKITCYFQPKGKREFALDRARLTATVEYSDRASGTWRCPPT